MKNHIKKSLKNSNGITLIVLVVTIIVLLILAGISISMLSGDNGILQRATDAKEKTTVVGEKEQIQLEVLGSHENDGTLLIGTVNSNIKNHISGVSTDDATEFPLTVTYTATGNKYEVFGDGKVEKNNSNPNILEISDLNENGNTYFGWDVINYSNSLGESLQDTEWQLLYAGKLDESDMDGRIYLISKNIIKYTELPTVIKNGSEISGAKPIETSDTINSPNAASFAKFSYSPSGGYLTGGVLSQYVGSSDITSTSLQKLNSQYFKWLTDNSKVSTNYNMKAISYMMDITTWEKFKGLNAEYAIGGPTIELLFAAYNKYTNKSEEELYKTKVESISGYLVSTNGGSTYNKDTGDAMFDDFPLISSVLQFWIASPSVSSCNANYIDNTGVFHWVRNSNYKIYRSFVYQLYWISTSSLFKSWYYIRKSKGFKRKRCFQNCRTIKIIE